MSAPQLFLMVFGAVLSLIGIAVFFLLAWFKGSGGEHNVVKLAQAEFRLSHPALVIFVVGVALMVAPFFLPLPSRGAPGPGPTLTATPTPRPLRTPTPTPTIALRATAPPTTTRLPTTTPTRPPAVVPAPTPTPTRLLAPTPTSAIGWYFDKPAPGSPIADPRVRRAIAYAIGEAQIRPDFFHLPNGPVLEGAAQSYDVVQATRLLAEAGYPNGFSGLCIVAADVVGTTIANTMVAHLARVRAPAIVNGPSCQGGRLIIRLFSR